MYFRIGLDLDGLILDVRFKHFFSNFVKIADFEQEDFMDIFLLAD